MIGPIRQELLSGIPTAESFKRLRDHLRPFADSLSTLRTMNVPPSTSIDAAFERFAVLLPITVLHP